MFLKNTNFFQKGIDNDGRAWYNDVELLAGAITVPAQQRSKQIGDVPDMKNEKLVYSAPSIKVSLVEEDILTWSETEFETGIEVTGDE